MKSERLLRACNRQPVDATPIWLMRQAGRYMSEYRALRERYTILEIIKNPDLATEVTLQPIKAFDLDAAIIFADILTILEGMGLPLEFAKGEGPIIDRPVRTAADVEALRLRPAEDALSFTLEAIKQVRGELDGKVPLVGFSGAPFTLASYAIEGGSSRNYVTAKTLMYEQPAVWHQLMDKLAIAVGDYLQAQIRAGAQAVQLFDSWVGALGPYDYETYVLPHSQKAIALATQDTDVPLINFSTNTGTMLPLLKQAGGSVMSVDWRVELPEAWAQVGDNVAIQGNLDPVLLFAPIPEIKKQAARILDSVQGKPGHIFNLGHGILQHTPVAHVAALIDFVHEYTESTR